MRKYVVLCKTKADAMSPKVWAYQAVGIKLVVSYSEVEGKATVCTTATPADARVYVCGGGMCDGVRGAYYNPNKVTDVYYGVDGMSMRRKDAITYLITVGFTDSEAAQYLDALPYVEA